MCFNTQLLCKVKALMRFVLSQYSENCGLGLG